MIGLADQLADAGNLLVHELGHGPVLVRATDVHSEVLQKLGAVGGMGHLGVELNACWCPFSHAQRRSCINYNNDSP